MAEEEPAQANASEMEPPAKRPRVDAGSGKAAVEAQANEGSPKPQPTTDAPVRADSSAALDEDFDAVVDSFDLDAEILAAKEKPEEVARKAFVERLAVAGRVAEGELPEILKMLRDEAPSWGTERRWRSTALFLVYVARSTRACRAAFVGEGMPLLGMVLQESVTNIESNKGGIERQEGGMRALACLMCLKSLPIGRATMWEHRVSVGKPFDRLYKWCGKEKSALAAEIRAPATALCQRWKRQAKPAGQETSTEQKQLRNKVIDIISQGLLGNSGGQSPAMPLTSPARLPVSSAAAEVEGALYGHYHGPTPEYRQHARMLRSNLAANSALRTRILEGDVGATDLIAMDSVALLPDSKQEARRLEETKNLRSSLIEDLMPIRMDSDDREAYNAGTAPPPLVKISRSLSSGSRENLVDAAAPSSRTEVAVPKASPFLEPMPTPFRAGISSPAPGVPRGDDGPMSDVAATPGPEDEDEEAQALVRYFSQPVA